MRTSRSYDNTRGGHPLWHLCVLELGGREHRISLPGDVGIGHCMGSPRTMPCSVGCCSTLPWITATINTCRIGNLGLSHGINQSSCVFLCKVKLQSECDYLSLLKLCLLVAFFSLAISLSRFWYASLPLISTSYFLTIHQNSDSLGVDIFSGVLQIATVVQTFMLGPRLILSMREYYAKLVVNSDDGIDMTSVVFQGRSYLSSSIGGPHPCIAGV